jgi:hypothetical protein
MKLKAKARNVCAKSLRSLQLVIKLLNYDTIEFTLYSYASQNLHDFHGINRTERHPAGEIYATADISTFNTVFLVLPQGLDQSEAKLGPNLASHATEE